jgi:short-subunit dehydrogenase
MRYYENKKIWITGASSGIGKALAIALSKMDTVLILSSRKKAALEEVKSLCLSAKAVHVLPLDLADHEGMDMIMEENRELLSTVDILFNNGGISQRSFAIETEFEVYKKLMDVNYLGSVKTTKFLLPYMHDRNSGHFVAVSSSAGKFGVPVRSGYSASKFALHGFYEALRAELHKTDIAITMVCPGYIKTDISLNALTADGKAQGTMDQAQANGMNVNTMVDKVLRAVSNKKEELLVGAFKETKAAVWMSRVFPSVFRKIIARSRVT